MKKTLYLECNSGISGDMTVGALLDLGADRKVLEDALASLGVDGYHLHFGTTEKCGIKAYDFDVHLEYEEHEHCHDHDHEHHHHHHADEVFTSWGKETVHKYTEEELDYLLKALSETTSYGTILRSKGIIQMTDGSWKQFDLVPEEYEVREGQPDYTGRICVIGTDLKEDDLLKLFHV